MDTYGAAGGVLLPLRHAQALLQACALLLHHVPAAVRVLGPNAGAGNTRHRVSRDTALPTPTGASWGQAGPSGVTWELVLRNKVLVCFPENIDFCIGQKYLIKTKFILVETSICFAKIQGRQADNHLCQHEPFGVNE